MAGRELSAAFLRTAGPGRYCDGDGLYLLVKKTGKRFWVFRYKVNGSKLREAGLGRAGEGRNCVRLAEAREKASELFRQVKAGIDPLTARDAVVAASKAAQQDAAIKGVTFGEAARRYIDAHAASWRNTKHTGQWTATIETYATPFFGEIPVSEISTTHVLAAIEPIWTTKAETASRLRGRIESILDYAKPRAPAILTGMARAISCFKTLRTVPAISGNLTTRRSWIVASLGGLRVLTGRLKGLAISTGMARAISCFKTLRTAPATSGNLTTRHSWIVASLGGLPVPIGTRWPEATALFAIVNNHKAAGFLATVVKVVKLQDGAVVTSGSFAA